MKKRYLSIYVFIILIAIITSINLNIFADIKQVNPNQSIYLSDTNNSENIFDENFIWYPGCAPQTKILRIINDNKFPVDITNTSIENIKLYDGSTKKEISSIDKKYASYIENMRVEVQFENKFLNLVRKGISKDALTFKSFKNGVDSSIRVNKNDYVDLIYTLSMDKNAPNEVQGIVAFADFKINTKEYIESKKQRLQQKIPEYVESNIELSYQTQNKDNVGAHWSSNCIDILLKNNIIEGYDDGAIYPNNYITRAEAAVLIVKALKIENRSFKSKVYKDELPDWAKKEILLLTSKGMFEGYEDNTFRPNNNISREEMITVLIRAFKIRDKNFENNFTDKNKISKWAEEAIAIGVSNSIIEGYEDNTFRPKNNIKRSEAFTLICKLLNLHKHGTTLKEN